MRQKELPKVNEKTAKPRYRAYSSFIIYVVFWVSVATIIKHDLYYYAQNRFLFAYGYKLNSYLYTPIPTSHLQQLPTQDSKYVHLLTKHIL